MSIKIKTDWHPADVKAALAKRGWTLTRVALEHGYGSRTTAAEVLRKPYPVMEAIVAGIIGVAPSRIWPTRYDKNGRPLGVRAALRKDPMDGKWSDKRR